MIHRHIHKWPRRRLLVVLVATASCGGLGEAPFAGLREPDVAPWRDLGPVAICEGAVRLGRPASRPAGFCVDELAAVTCGRDGDCRSRERCVCGLCQVAWCEAADECDGGDVCNFAEHRCDRPCKADGECAAGERCEPGLSVCRATCGGTGECQAGEVCDDGLCAVSQGVGGRCAADRDCIEHPLCALQRRPADLREPAVLVEDERVVLYFERVEAGMSSIWRASMLDGDASGRRFRIDPGSPVVVPGPGEAGRAGAPSVVRGATGGIVLAFADGNGRLRLATSPDGLQFAVEDAPLLSPGAPAWQASGLDAPSLVAPRDSPAGSWLLYFATRDRSAIGLAAGPDTTHLGADASPFLSPASVTDPTLWREVDRVGAPDAVPLRSPGGAVSIRLLFDARGRESADAMQFGVPVTEPANDSLGAAASTDGHAAVIWPWNPVLDRTIQYLDHPSEQQPALAVLPVSGRALLYYRGASADGTRSENLRVAQAPAP